MVGVEPAARTIPPAGALIGVPSGTAISMPRCGPRPRRRRLASHAPKGDEMSPETGAPASVPSFHRPPVVTTVGPSSSILTPAVDATGGGADRERLRGTRCGWLRAEGYAVRGAGAVARGPSEDGNSARDEAPDGGDR